MFRERPPYSACRLFNGGRSLTLRTTPKTYPKRTLKAPKRHLSLTKWPLLRHNHAPNSQKPRPQA